MNKFVVFIPLEFFVTWQRFSVSASVFCWSNDDNEVSFVVFDVFVKCGSERNVIKVFLY